MNPIDNPLEDLKIKESNSSNDDFEYVEKSGETTSLKKSNEDSPLNSNFKSNKLLKKNGKSKKKIIDDPLYNNSKSEEINSNSGSTGTKESPKNLYAPPEISNDSESEDSIKEAKEIPKKPEKEESIKEIKKKEIRVKSPNNIKKPEKSRKDKKRKKKEKLKEIILNIYRNSIYLEFFKAASVLTFDYLQYISPIGSNKLLKSFIILTDFGLVIFIEKEFFVEGSNWYNVKAKKQKSNFSELKDSETLKTVDLQNSTETKPLSHSQEMAVDQPKLPFRREYFVIPYTLIDELDHNTIENILTISTKVSS
jgi:hypothetical protein